MRVTSTRYHERTECVFTTFIKTSKRHGCRLRNDQHVAYQGCQGSFSPADRPQNKSNHLTPLQRADKKPSKTTSKTTGTMAFPTPGISVHTARPVTRFHSPSFLNGVPSNICCAFTVDTWMRGGPSPVAISPAVECPHASSATVPAARR